MIERIYLDLDGVLADFVGAMCKAHKRTSPYPERKGEMELSKLWGISDSEFWAPSRGEGFWLAMEKLPRADEIVGRAVTRVGSVNRVYIATSPSADRYSRSGKHGWVERWFPALKSRVVIIKDKWMLARPGRMLVDDTPKHVDSWRSPPDGSEGGTAIWCPSEWNTAPEENLLGL